MKVLTRMQMRGTRGDGPGRHLAAATGRGCGSWTALLVMRRRTDSTTHRIRRPTTNRFASCATTAPCRTNRAADRDIIQVAASSLSSSLMGTARIVCGTGSTLRYGVRSSVCLSHHRPISANPLLQVCCCEPGGQKISIDCCTATYGRRMRVVPRCQRT